MVLRVRGAVGNNFNDASKPVGGLRVPRGNSIPRTRLNTPQLEALRRRRP